MQFYSTAAYVALLSGGLVSAFPAELVERAGTCNTDNCYRFFKGAAPLAASSYCESFLSSTPGTVTSVVSSTSYITPAQPTVTTTVGTTTTTVETLCTTTTTASPVYINKRVVTAPFSVQASAACTANKAAQTARISSACSCVLISATATVTSTVTNTLPTPTAATATTSFASTATVASCTSYTTATVTPTCQNGLTPCNPSFGCYRSDYPPDSTSNNGGCIGCLSRGTGCDDGQTYCIEGYRDHSPSCTYDSDCSAIQPYGNTIPLCMRYPNGVSFCGSNGKNADGTGPNGLYCIARTMAVRRNEEWEEAVRVAKVRDVEE